LVSFMAIIVASRTYICYNTGLISRQTCNAVAP